MKKIDEIKKKLDEFVENGGNVQELTKNDQIYLDIKNLSLKINGKNATVEEKFSYFGYPRDKMKLDIDGIKTLIDIYLINGGTFNVPIKSLPFYQQINSIVRTRINNGYPNATFEDVMFELGYKNFKGKINPLDTIAKTFIKLADYQDDSGFVDSYRKSQHMRSCMSAISDYLDMPESLIVTLVAQQKLDKVYVQTDRIKYLRQSLIEFATKHNNSLKNIKRLDSRLYEAFINTKKFYQSENGKIYSSKEFLEILDLDYLESNFKFNDTTNFDPTISLQEIFEIAKSNNNSISNEQIRTIPTFLNFYAFIRRNNTTIQDYLSNFGITYLNAQIHTHNCLVVANKYPYFCQMETLKNELFNKFKAKHPTLSQDKLFEAYLQICKDVYCQFKNKIHENPLNFDLDNNK